MASAKKQVVANCGNGVQKLRQLLQEWFKAMQRHNNNFTCFLCCHVLTGTIIIGFLHTLLHVISLVLIAIELIHPEILMASRNETRDDVPPAIDCAETLLCCQGNDNSSRGLSLYLGNIIIIRVVNTEEVYAALVFTLCTFVCTLLLIYGAFRRQPSYLIPFFFLQIFAFCFSSMTVICYFFYNVPDIRQLIRDIRPFPFQQQLLQMNARYSDFIFTVIFMIILTVQVYFISVLWRCYEFLINNKAKKTRHSVLASDCDQGSQCLVVGDDYDTGKFPDLYSESPPSLRKKNTRVMADTFSMATYGQTLP